MSRPPGSLRRTCGAMALISIVAASCSSGDPIASQPIPSTIAPVRSTTTPAAATTDAPSTAVPSTSEPVVSTVPDTTPAPVETAPPTTLPPTTTTTEPLAVQELLLRADGLGSARFGASPDGVIDYVTSILGGNTGDTGWVDPQTFANCDGTVARRVDWGVLSLLFNDLSDFANGRRHFMGYEYGRVGEIGDEPVGLRTPGGTTLGSRVVDLLADFPEAAVNPGEQGTSFPPNFYVNNNLYGLVTGVDAEDFVTVVFGGYGCGE